MDDFLIEDLLIGPVYREYFLGIFRDTKTDSERLCLKLPIINIQRVMGG